MRPDTAGTLRDLQSTLERILRLAKDASLGEIARDERLRYALFAQFVILGEAANRLPRDWCAAHPEVPWADIVGMRHRLVHGYDAIDWGILWDTIEREVPDLAATVDRLVSESPASRSDVE